jgi:hypothetical protein
LVLVTSMPKLSFCVFWLGVIPLNRSICTSQSDANGPRPVHGRSASSSAVGDPTVYSSR